MICSMSASNVNRTSSLISTRYMWISLGLSVIGMAVIIWFTYSPVVLDHLRLKRMPGLVLAVVVTLLRAGFVAAKIRFLAEGALSWMASVRIALTWDFASAVTPSTVGGAPVATYAMSREGIKLGKSTAIILYGVDRKSTRLNSSHVAISYAVFCLKKKTTEDATQ